MAFFLLSYMFIIVMCFLPANLWVIVLLTFLRFCCISLVCILCLKFVSLLFRYMSSGSTTALVSFYFVGVILYALVIILRYFAWFGPNAYATFVFFLGLCHMFALYVIVLQITLVYTSQLCISLFPYVEAVSFTNASYYMVSFYLISRMYLV